MSRKFKLIKIVKIGGLRALKMSKIPMYWSKHLRKDYIILGTNRQVNG